MLAELSTRSKALLLLSLRSLGDAPGHEFHGNQWTAGGASVSVAQGAVRSPKFDAAVKHVAGAYPELLGSHISIQVVPKGSRTIAGKHTNGTTFRNIKIEGGKPVRDAAGNLLYSGRYSISISDKRASTQEYVATLVHELEHVRQWEQEGKTNETGAHSKGHEAGRKFAGLAAPSKLRDSNPIHRAADANYKQMMLIVSAAFMRGRKAYKSSGTDAAVKAIRASLAETLPPVLAKVYAAGGNAAVRQLRAAGDVEGHEFHGNQWTAGGGSIEPIVSGNWVTFKSENGALEGKVSNGVLQVKESVVKESERGKGEGKKLYESALNYARSKGLELHSSEAVSVSADHAWQSLAKRGYGVERVKQTELDPFLNKHYSVKDHPLGFKIRSGEPVWRSLELRTLKPISIRFDVTDPNAIAWAKDHAAELADGISETSHERIKNAIADALAGDGIDAAYDEILEAVGSEDRADVIARTETMAAANEGNRQGLEQAVEAELLPEDSRIEWIATSGCCDDCDALDGETRPIDGEYEDADAGDGPPLHPNCRCTEGVSA